jgi:hypothetical protein
VNIVTPGVIYISKTYIELIVGDINDQSPQFKSGATAEEISQQFPSVALRDVYLIIAHYLSYPDEIDAYLSQRQIEAAELQRGCMSLLEERACPCRPISWRRCWAEGG